MLTSADSIYVHDPYDLLCRQIMRGRCASRGSLFSAKFCRSLSLFMSYYIVDATLRPSRAPLSFSKSRQGYKRANIKFHVLHAVLQWDCSTTYCFHVSFLLLSLRSLFYCLSNLLAALCGSGRFFAYLAHLVIRIFLVCIVQHKARKPS
jgi:hypothetical protein